MQTTQTIKQEVEQFSGIKVNVCYIKKGTLKGNFRIQDKANNVQWWGNDQLIQQFNDNGFVDFDEKPLTKFSGNGGSFSIFVHKKY